MKLAIVICVLWLLIASNEAAIARAKFYDEEHPGSCTLSKSYVLSIGQKGKALNNPCAGVTCLENSYVEFQTCPPMAPPKGCKLRDFVNTDRSFPECCERTFDCTPKI